MKIDNTHKIKKTIVFLKNKILYCQANGLSKKAKNLNNKNNERRTRNRMGICFN